MNISLVALSVLISVTGIHGVWQGSDGDGPGCVIGRKEVLENDGKWAKKANMQLKGIEQLVVNDANNMWAFSGGKVFQWKDNKWNVRGETFKPLSFNLLAVSQDNSVYGVLRPDLSKPERYVVRFDGKTWQKMAKIPGNGKLSVAKDGTILFFDTDNGSIYQFSLKPSREHGYLPSGSCTYTPPPAFIPQKGVHNQIAAEAPTR